MKKKRNRGRFYSLIKLSKIYRIMRLICLFLLFALVQVSASTYSQNTKISVSGNNLTIEQVFGMIEDQSEFSFFYNEEQVDLSKKVKIDIVNGQLKKVMDYLLVGTDITYSINNRLIIVHEKDKNNPLKMSIQQSPVSGKVTDENELPLPGVTVVVKGTTNGTITDSDGNYSMTNVPADAVLVFSFVGMKTQEQSINNQAIINVALQEETIGIEEVVAIGYGTMKKSDLTGSVANVKIESLNQIPANNVEKLLQGRAAGLQIINSSDDPGAGTTVRIRGASSINGGNSPLLVVDGFPLGSAGNLKQINPSDIESVEVLKDASSSAIYGSRGANGVILITTKKGKAGTTQVTFSTQTTLSQFTSKLDIYNDPVLFADLHNEGRINQGWEPYYVGRSELGVYYPSVSELQSGEWPHQTYWPDYTFRDPISENYNLSVSGGDDKTKYKASVNYYKDKGIEIANDYDKITASLSFDRKLYSNVTLSNNVIITSTNRNNNSGLSFNRNPIYPVYNDDGSYYMIGERDFYHPVAITNEVLNKSKTLDILAYSYLDWQIIPELNFRTQLNYKYGNSVSDKYEPRVYTNNGYLNNGLGSISNWAATDLLSESYLTFSKTFSEVHKITAMGGFSAQQSSMRSSHLQASDFVNDVLQNENLSTGNPEKQTVSNGATESTLMSWLGRFNYVYDSRFLFTLTARADGSSKFGANNKWAFIPSSALGWNVHNENFMKTQTVFSLLKIRSSFGYTGNEGISSYQTLSRLGNARYYDNGEWQTTIGPGYISRWEYIYKIWGGIPNPDLKWETTSQFDLGVDMNFFSNKLRITADYYFKHTSDLLRLKRISPSSGYDEIWVNDGEIENRGIELSIGADIIDKQDFHFSANLMLSKNRDQVVNIGDATEGLATTSSNMVYQFTGSEIERFRSPLNILGEGESRNVFYGILTDGIIQTKEEGLAAGLTGDMAEPGEIKYIDSNNDGVVNVDDRTVIGNPNPDFFGSLNLDFEYKQFSLSVFLNGVYGNDVFNMAKFQTASTKLQRWTPDNPNNNFPRLRDGRSYYVSDWWIEDGSFLRIQNLTFAYNFDVSTLKAINTARIFINAENLYTFSGYKGYDPEVGTLGIDWGGYPRLRKLTLGLNVTF